MTRPIHIVHVLYRFAAGGLENVLVQLINGLPHEQFRHTVIALTAADEVFARRIERTDVELISLHKPPGQPFKLYPEMYRLLRNLRPDVVHGCNISALEFMPVAAAAGVPLRVQAEHGWDIADPDGSNRRYRFLRRIYKHSVHEFVAVSSQLHDYLRNAIGLPEEKVHLIRNGVDVERFRPRRSGDPVPEGWPFDPHKHVVIGTVGRLESIKNQALLVDAFCMFAARPEYAHLRLAIIGAGPLMPLLLQKIEHAGYRDKVWLPGSRSDVDALLRRFDLFVLPSLAEGSSCTLQEAMATGLPIIATDVGGNADLLDGGRYARLVESDNRQALYDAIAASLTQEGRETAAAAREKAVRDYAVDATLRLYQALFSPDREPRQ